MTGRWNCGDSSYLDDNLKQAFPVIETALQDNWESLIDEQGYLSNAKINILFAKPDLWLEWERLSEHKMAIFRTVEILLRYECWDKNGNYYISEDGFYYPRTDYSLPVFDPRRGRIHFPNFELKKTFIRILEGRNHCLDAVIWERYNTCRQTVCDVPYAGLRGWLF